MQLGAHVATWCNMFDRSKSAYLPNADGAQYRNIIAYHVEPLNKYNYMVYTEIWGITAKASYQQVFSCLLAYNGAEFSKIGSTDLMTRQ